jgi:exosortase
LWLWLGGELSFEWSVSEQYGYGLFVPLLCVYLLWLRAGDSPAPAPAAWAQADAWWLFLGAAALAQYPNAVLFAANADWRLLAWGEALTALLATLLLLARWGGAPWVRHFAPALLLFMFAVPWPSRVQINLVEGLMNLVTSVTVEALHWLGYVALQEGNTIRLPSGDVNIEEACSGVRSLQSTLMAGWLVGELWRYRPTGRGLLLVGAALVAIFFNLARTLTLSLISASYGPDVMSHWHNTTGFLVFGLSFAAMLSGAWWMRPPPTTLTPAKSAAAGAATAPAWLPMPGVAVILALLAGALPFSLAWYALRAPDIAGRPRWGLDVAAAVPDAKVEPADAELCRALFCEAGEQASWTDAQGHPWMLYYFTWQRPRAAQLGGVHVPERCLPAVGWGLERQGPDLRWQRDGVTLIFNTYVFVHGPERVCVFYCQWDPAGYHYETISSRDQVGRLFDAWHGLRMEDKRMLEIGIFNVESLTDATRAAVRFLDAAVAPLPLSNGN